MVIVLGALIRRNVEAISVKPENLYVILPLPGLNQDNILKSS